MWPPTTKLPYLIIEKTEAFQSFINARSEPHPITVALNVVVEEAVVVKEAVTNRLIVSDDVIWTVIRLREAIGHSKSCVQLAKQTKSHRDNPATWSFCNQTSEQICLTEFPIASLCLNGGQMIVRSPTHLYIRNGRQILDGRVRL